MAEVKIICNSIKDVPTAKNFLISGNEDTPIILNADNFSSNFYDADFDTLKSIQILNLPTNGSLKLSETPVQINQTIQESALKNLTFEPDYNWFGLTNFK